jgi:hypothetical protein
MRIVCLLVIGVVLAGVGTLSAQRAVEAPRSAPVALIDLDRIFGGGDENEPNENEPDEGGPAHHRPAGGQAHGRSGSSLPLVLLGVVLGAVGALFVANRLRRLRVRLRAWGARR